MRPLVLSALLLLATIPSLHGGYILILNDPPAGEAATPAALL